MPKFVFHGRILPPQLPLTLEHQPRVSVREAETIPDAVFTLDVTESVIRVDAEVEAFDANTWDGLFFYAHDLLKTSVELATLKDGVVYTPLIEHAIDPLGNEREPVLADRGLASLMSTFRTYTFEQVMEIVAGDVALVRAVSDIVVMLSWTNYTPIAAGRAVESILHMFTGGRSAADWDRLRTALRVDRKYVQLLTDYAVGPRHGHRQYVSGEVNRKLAERAWTIMDRYLALRLSDNQSLDPTKYEILAG